MYGVQTQNQKCLSPQVWRENREILRAGAQRGLEVSSVREETQNEKWCEEYRKQPPILLIVGLKSGNNDKFSEKISIYWHQKQNNEKSGYLRIRGMEVALCEK